MFTDPFSVTYNSVALSLPRTGSDRRTSVYRTADGEFSIKILNPSRGAVGPITASIMLARTVPDPNAADVFSATRTIVNAFSFGYRFDSSLEQTSVDIPRLRTALDSLVTSTLQSRLFQGEK